MGVTGDRVGRRAVVHTVTESLRWVPPRIDMGVAHPARMHDYWLGGARNFAADRELAEKVLQAMPGVEDISRLNQAFLRRAALFLVDAGIRQFIDLGSGIPTIGNLHEVVQRAAPESRVFYVDPDPVAVAHTELILENTPGTAVMRADLRDVHAVLEAAATRGQLDITAPIGIIAVMMHFIPDSSDPGCMLAAYRDRLPSGSYLVLAQGSADTDIPGLPDVLDAYRSTRHPLHPRTHAEVLRMCDGFELVEPGLVGFAHWRPDGPGDLSSHPGINSILYAAVGRKS